MIYNILLLLNEEVSNYTNRRYNAIYVLAVSSDLYENYVLSASDMSRGFTKQTIYKINIECLPDEILCV